MLIVVGRSELAGPIGIRTLFSTKSSQPIRFFTNSVQYKNANIANFVLAVPLEMNKSNTVFNPRI